MILLNMRDVQKVHKTKNIGNEITLEQYNDKLKKCDKRLDKTVFVCRCTYTYEQYINTLKGGMIDFKAPQEIKKIKPKTNNKVQQNDNTDMDEEYVIDEETNGGSDSETDSKQNKIIKKQTQNDSKKKHKSKSNKNKNKNKN